MIEFQSAHPVRGATITPSMFTLVSAYFNPRAPCGARQTRIEFASDNIKFQSTRPVWGATYRGDQPVLYREFQSTRPVWGATGAGEEIHRHGSNFNPRAPCGARRPNSNFCGCDSGFQSTRPVWGATRKNANKNANENYFNPRAPCGARLLTMYGDEQREAISIHAPRVGRDSKFDDFTPSNLHKRYKRVLARPKNTREKGKIKQKLAYIHAFSAFLGCEGSGTFCALVLRTQYR